MFPCGIGKEGEIMKWFAVQKDRTDQWDNGSYNYLEAVEMLEAQGCGLIAVIDENSGLCVEEIEYEDLEKNED